MLQCFYAPTVPRLACFGVNVRRATPLQFSVGVKCQDVAFLSQGRAMVP